MKNELGEIDRLILNAVKEAKNPISTYDVAKKTGISWSTASSHCYKLMAFGILESKSEKSRAGVGHKIMWNVLK